MKKILTFAAVFGLTLSSFASGEKTKDKKVVAKKQITKPIKVVKNSRIIPKEKSLAPKELFPIINKKK